MNDYQKALQALESAIARFVQAARADEEGVQHYVTQYSLIVASESMLDGQTTHFTYSATASTPKYQIRGLLTEAMHHYRSAVE